MLRVSYFHTILFSFSADFLGINMLIGVDMKSYLIVLAESDPLYTCSILGFLWFPLYKTNAWIYF